MDESLFRGKGGLVAIAGLGAVAIVLSFLATGGSGDEADVPGSTYNEGGDGVSNYRIVLEGLGYDVVRRRIPVSASRPAYGTTLMILDADPLAEAEIAAVADFARSGGRVVAGGPVARQLAGGVAPGGGSVDRAHRLFPHPRLSGVAEISVVGMDMWTDPGDSLGLYGTTSLSAVSFKPLGSGVLFLMAGGAPLNNHNLPLADNATFGVRVAGQPGTRVEFAEYALGFERSSGLGAIPTRWKWALGLAAVAGLVWILAHARRLGPPEPADRIFPPPRSRYVDSLAVLLNRSRAPGAALAPVRDTIRQRIARRGWDVSDPDGRGMLASHLGVPEEDLRLALSEAESDEAVMAVGRVLAATGTGSRGAR